MTARAGTWIVGAWLLACSGAPEVDVQTQVGKVDPSPPSLREWAQAWSQAREAPPPVPASSPAVLVDPLHAPRDAAETYALVDALRRGPRDELPGVAARLAAATPDTWPAVAALLREAKRGRRSDYKAVLAVIGGDVPNRWGHFDLAWKQAHGFTVKRSEDWLGDLLAVPSGKISSLLGDVYRECVLTAALLRAASRAGADPERASDVVATLLDVGMLNDGIFRDDVSRAIMAIGDEAVAPLLVAAILPARPKDREAPAGQRAAFAEQQLDRMDRLHPARAVAAGQDDVRRRSAILAALGVARRGEAAEVLIEYVDDASPAVRAAARIALLSFVAGPAPELRSRSIKLLGGGVGRAQAFLTHREHAARALRTRLGERAEPPCEPPEGLPTRHCQQQPLRHALAYFAELDEVRRTREHAALDQALAQHDYATGVQAIDAVLAAGPTDGVPPDVATYLERAGRAALAEGSPTRAARWLRKAAMLAEDTPADGQRLRVDALLTEASLPELPAQGRAMLLRTAAALRPGDARIEAALHGTLVQSATPDRLPRALATGVPLVAAGLWALAVIGAAVRRRRSATGGP